MFNFKKKIFIFFLSLYLFIGSYNSINTGISFDEKIEELNWNFHFNFIKDLTNNIVYKKKFDKQKFNKEVRSFVGYGIGSQLISQPIQFFLQDLIKHDKI